jgi:hypothetical protein
MSTILETIFENQFSNKDIREKEVVYRSLISSPTDEKFQFFSLFDKALDDIIGTELGNILCEALLNNIKIHKNQYCDTLLQKIVEKHINRSIPLTMTVAGWNVLKNNSKLCYDYIKFRNIKLNPSMQNIRILNAVRKHNIHICNNHVLYWIKTNKLNKFMTSNAQHVSENKTDLAIFFSKLSNQVIKLIIPSYTRGEKKEIYFPLLCNNNLDQTDIDNIFEIYDMKKFVERHVIINYFLHININIFKKYYISISNTIRPHHSIIEHLNDIIYNKQSTLTNNQKYIIIDFALFFHMKKSERGVEKSKDVYEPIITTFLEFFSAEQQLKLHEKFIDDFNLEYLCAQHFDPLVAYYRRKDIFSEGMNLDIYSIYPALINCSIEALKLIDVSKLIVEEYEESEDCEVVLAQLITTFDSLSKEKKDELFEQFKKSYKILPREVLVTLDQFYQNELIKQIYVDSINNKLKKYKLDQSLIKIDTNLSCDDMINVIFDVSEQEFGKCNICWEKNVEYSCKNCGNCACGTCRGELSRCAICKCRPNFLKLYM